jgi:hypothetical protein
MLVQSGKPVGVFRTHEWAPRVLLANSNLVPDWANWDEFRRLEASGLTMYGQMTAGSWIYIGTQGILQGTYETFAEPSRRKRFGGTLAGTLTLTAGLGGMGGAQPLAVTMNDGVALCIDVDPTRRARASRAATSTRSPTTSTTRWPGCIEARDAATAVVGCSATPPTCCPSCSRGRPGRHRHRPDQRARPAQLRAEGLARRGDRERPHRTRGVHRARAARWRARRGDGRLPWTRAPRCSTTATTSAPRPQARRLRARLRLPRLRARLHPAAVLRGQGPVPLGGALGRPGRHRRHRPAVLESSPTTTTCAAGSRWPRSACLPGPARAHLLARLRRARPRRPAVQRDGRERRGEGADRHRPRPPRLRLGRLALPRDRGHDRRQRRHRRLAAAQRHGQHASGASWVSHPPRRRRRHRPLASTPAW